MGTLQLMGMMESCEDFDTVLSWHLTSNHYPPIGFMFDACKQAIEAANEGDFCREIDLPDGTTYRGSTHAPAYAIAEAHHLDGFLNDDEGEY